MNDKSRKGDVARSSEGGEGGEGGGSRVEVEVEEEEGGEPGSRVSCLAYRDASQTVSAVTADTTQRQSATIASCPPTGARDRGAAPHRT